MSIENKESDMKICVEENHQARYDPLTHVVTVRTNRTPTVFIFHLCDATGQNQGISHGLQIGKDQGDSSQDADHGYQFNNIVFIDEISIFAETPEGMQTLLDVVQELTTWCGVEINVKKRSCS